MNRAAFNSNAGHLKPPDRYRFAVNIFFLFINFKALDVCDMNEIACECECI